jgi:hypothetical protein
MPSKSGMWKTKDGREVPIRDMADSHLNNAIKYFECRGALSFVMTPEERAEDPVAMAEYNMSELHEFIIEKYKELVEERDRRARVVKSTRLAMLEPLLNKDEET